MTGHQGSWKIQMRTLSFLSLVTLTFDL